LDEAEEDELDEDELELLLLLERDLPPRCTSSSLESEE
jgi:hypothetical protein